MSTKQLVQPNEGSSNVIAKPVSLPGSLAGNSGCSLTEALYGLASGIVFGMVSPVVGHPFDSIKTRMQAETRYQHATFRQTVSQIYRLEGVGGFYRGFVPPLIGSMAFRGVLFSAYAGAYSACEQIPVLTEPIPYTGGLRPSVLVGALAASVARALIESPLDFIKVRYMIGKGVQDASATQALSSTTLVSSFRSFASSPVHNVRHLYHGFTPTLFRTIGLLGSFFVMVDYSVRYIPDVVNAPMIGPFFKGGVCATTAWVFAFPFETAKSVIQADQTGKYKQMQGATWKVIRDLYKERGIKALYRGFGPGAGRSFVANGTSMMVYAWFNDMIRKE